MDWSLVLWALACVGWAWVSRSVLAAYCGYCVISAAWIFHSMLTHPEWDFIMGGVFHMYSVAAVALVFIYLPVFFIRERIQKGRDAASQAAAQ